MRIAKARSILDLSAWYQGTFLRIYGVRGISHTVCLGVKTF